MDIIDLLITYFLINFFIATFIIYMKINRNKQRNKKTEIKHYIGVFTVLLFCGLIIVFTVVIFTKQTEK
jgi:hypothetical protein